MRTSTILTVLRGPLIIPFFKVLNVGRLSCGYPLFEGAPIRYFGEILVTIWLNSGEIPVKRAKTQETHNKNITQPSHTCGTAAHRAVWIDSALLPLSVRLSVDVVARSLVERPGVMRARNTTGNYSVSPEIMVKFRRNSGEIIEPVKKQEPTTET